MCFFSIIRIINILFFYLGLTLLLKFKRGQGQTYVIVLAIKFLKTVIKEFLTNSPGPNSAYIALLDKVSLVSFFLIRTSLLQNKFVQKINLFGL